MCGISECRLLKHSTADVPQILRPRQVQRVRFTSNGPLRVWIESQLPEGVFVVHEIVQRKSRKGPRSGQLLEECAMRAIRRIIVTASAKISSANPWFEFGCVEQISTFDAGCISAMPQQTPTSRLDRAPEQHIRLAVACIKYVSIVAADRGDIDGLVIFRTNRRR